MHAPGSQQQPGPLEASIFVEALRAHAGSFVAGALILHAILWTLAPVISEPMPSPKIALGLATGRERMLGPVMVAITGWLVFAFARRIVGEREGAIATLVMVGVHPVAFPVGALDSALLQMPLIA